MACLVLFIILIAKYAISIPILILAYYILRNKSHFKKIAVYGILCFLFVGVFTLFAGKIYNNPRPFVVTGIPPFIQHAADNGFPSDHVLIAAAISAILLPFSKTLGTISLLIAILIGIARVHVGLHHTADIIGSLIIAVFGGILSYYISKVILKKYIKSTSNW